MRLDSVAIVLFVWKNAVQCWGGRVGEWESRRGAQNSKKNVQNQKIFKDLKREFLNTL